MVALPVLLVLASVLAVIGVIGIVMHEFIHYLVARPWTSALHFQWSLLYPNVQFDAPYEVPERVIRLAGAAPFITVGTIAAIGLRQLFSSGNMLVGAFLTVFGAAISVPSFGSTGDILAVANPSAFQLFAANNEGLPSVAETLRLVRRE